MGGTPLVRLRSFSEEVTIYGKVESFNPMGSIKDRAALFMLERAESDGRLREGMTVIEPTSGNTGIGLALACACKGYDLRILMPDDMSIERRRIMAALGADVVLTPGAEGMVGAVERAESMSRDPDDTFMVGQFSNPDNALAHELTTGPEILDDLPDLDAVVAGIGTGGTITGIARCLRSHGSDASVVGVEPEGSPVLSGGEAGRHRIEGIGAGFVPEVLDTGLVDRVMSVSDDDARKATRALASNEGILAGISSGAALHAATVVAEDLPPGSKVVVILPDSGERYLSTDLFL